MSFIDDILNPPAAPALTVINGTAKRDSLHPYADAIRRAWLHRLDNLTRPWVKGAAWDTNSFVTARKLIELANSPWAGYQITDAKADYLIHAPSDSVWDKREKCWDQAYARAAGHTLPEPAAGTPLPVTVLDDVKLLDDRPRINPAIDWHELFNLDDDEEWIVEPLLPARRLIALYSPPKVGKSLLMLELAVAISRGTQVLGTQTQQHRVLYIDFENDPRGDIRTRLEDMRLGPDDLDGLVYLSYPSLAKLDTIEGGRDLIRHIEHYNCTVVVIDTISRAVAGEENTNDTWLNFYRHTGLALKQAGIACIRLDHSGKDAERGMRGGSAKYGDVDAVWRLTHITDDTLKLECTDHRVPIAEKILTLTRLTEPLKHRVEANAFAAMNDARINDAIQILDGLDVAGSAGRDICMTALKEAGYVGKTGFGKDIMGKVVKVRKLRHGIFGGDDD